MNLLTTLRAVTAVALLAALGFLLAPAGAEVEPLEAPTSDTLQVASGSERLQADSLAEDIILYNLFSPSRSAPNRRTTSAVTPDDAPNEVEPANGFSPELVGTAVSDRPEETKALLKLLANDPAPRLYAVGDRAGGYTVVSIEARSVVLNGPRGRVVLRLPQEENHS